MPDSVNDGEVSGARQCCQLQIMAAEAKGPVDITSREVCCLGQRGKSCIQWDKGSKRCRVSALHWYQVTP